MAMAGEPMTSGSLAQGVDAEESFMKRLAIRSSLRGRTFSFCVAATCAMAGFVLTALPSAQQPAPARQPAVTGVLPGGPVFLPGRPTPPVGNVLDIESLIGVPSDEFRME